MTADSPALLTPSRVRQLLSEHGLAPSKRLGQNFVIDANTVRKMVLDAGIQPGDHVVEIGPGLGSLTLALRAAGAHVVAVEVDRGLARALAHVVDDGVRIVHADALGVDYSELTDTATGGPARFMGNLPYNVATPLVMTALESDRFVDLHVMVQREVGERWCARPGDERFGAVSVKISALAEARIMSTVSRTAFWPVPRVDSVTVALRARSEPVSGRQRHRLFALVEAGFAQRRKRLRNSLAAGGWDPSQVDDALRQIDVGLGVRAEELSLPQWQRLCAALPVRSGSDG